MKKYGAHTYQLSPDEWRREIDNLRSSNPIIRHAAKTRLGIPCHGTIAPPEGGPRWEGQWQLHIPQYQEPTP